jgi:poly-gamma-glutamate synthesis protein (capsule biosynthesis protein)
VDLLFVGDVMLGRLVNDVLEREPPEYPWGDTLSLFRGADWRLCNLECVIADGGQPWTATPKTFHFRSDAKNVAVLTAARIDAVSLANNHTLDFGFGAMSEMLSILDRAGIRHAGAGADLAEASRPAIFETPAGTIGLLAFTDNEPGWAATDARPGIFYAPIDVSDQRAMELIRLVRRTAEEVDLLVVSAHWGPNWGRVPPSNHVAFALALVDAGAAVIYGHSGHIVRGVGIDRGRPMLYCAGDFIDDYAVDAIERNDQGLIFVLRAEAGRVRAISMCPTVIRDFQARLAQGPEQEEIARKMRHLCADLGTRASWSAAEGSLVVALPGMPEGAAVTERLRKP